MRADPGREHAHLWACHTESMLLREQVRADGQNCPSYVRGYSCWQRVSVITAIAVPYCW